MRTKLAETGEIIICPCCGEKGRKHRTYAMRVECQKAYIKKKNAEWRAKNPHYKRKSKAKKGPHLKSGPKKAFAAELVERAKTLMDNGYTQAETAAKLDVTLSMLRTRLKNHGMTKRKVVRPKPSDARIDYTEFKKMRDAGQAQL